MFDNDLWTFKPNQNATLLRKAGRIGIMKKSMAAKTRYEDGEIYGVLLPYFCGVEGMEEKHMIQLIYDKKATYLLRTKQW